MKPITIFRGTSGLNTVDDPARIVISENGISDVAEIVNMTISRSGRPSTRNGLVELATGSFHSLYSDGNNCFVGKGSALFSVASDHTLTGIRSGLVAGAKIDYAQFGDRTYYTNGFDIGWIKDGVSNVWEQGTYIGPETHRVFSEPIIGNHLAAFSGRILISEDNVLWWSELYDFGLFNKAESFVQFHTKITMISPVTGGYFLSTERNTYFVSGVNPKTWQLIHVANYPAVEWSKAKGYIECSEIGLSNPGLCSVWTSPEGVIAGIPSGQLVNLNKNKVIYPETAKHGFGCFMGYNYIHGLE